MASQTITGDALQFTQDNKHGYCYAGALASSTTPATAMEFTTGAYYIVGELNINMGLQTGASPTTTAFAALYFNEVLVSQIIAGLSGIDSWPSATQQIIIPADTTVKVNIWSEADESARLITTTITGRVYEYLPVRN